jgi:hypothetical protein
VLPGHTQTPSQIMGNLLTGHLEAASLQAEASHRRALPSKRPGSATRHYGTGSTRGGAAPSISVRDCSWWSCWVRA